MNFAINKYLVCQVYSCLNSILKEDMSDADKIYEIKKYFEIT